MKKGQLSDNTVHMLLTIVIIVIIVLIVSFMFPKFSKPFADEINSIRKDVFGIGVSEMEEGEEEKAINSFEEVVKAFEETSKGNIGCVSNLKSIPPFSNKYSIGVQGLGEKTKLSLYDKSNVMPQTEDVDNPVILEGIKPCVMKNPVEVVKEQSSFIIKYSSAPYIEAGWGDLNFYDNFPVLYKKSKNEICFITKKIDSFFVKNKQYFDKLPVCGQVTVAEKK